MSDERQFVIFSHEHDAWWAANRCGYTLDLSKAGRYTAEEAGEITIGVIPPGSDVAMLAQVAERHGPRLCFGYSVSA